MKKLYAKTSFAHKKTSKQSKATNGIEPDLNEIHRYPSPIMAYRQTNTNSSNSGSNGSSSFDTATINKTPKLSRAFSLTLCDESHSITPPMSLESNESFFGDFNESSPHYYSIGDIEQLQPTMLNVQELNWQEQQRARQQEWRRRLLTKTPVLTAPLTPFHQHTKMVLKQQKTINVADELPTKAASPIYEQPNIQMTRNGFASLPHDINLSNNQRDNVGNVGYAASTKCEEAVSSINSLKQRLWQGNVSSNNQYEDKCLQGTKSMLHHTQSMPMSRTKPTTSNQQNNNFYQQSDAELQQNLQNYNNLFKKSERLQQQQEQFKTYNTLPIKRHNSVKPNIIGRFSNGVVAAMHMYVIIFDFLCNKGEFI